LFLINLPTQGDASLCPGLEYFAPLGLLQTEMRSLVDFDSIADFAQSGALEESKTSLRLFMLRLVFQT